MIKPLWQRVSCFSVLLSFSVSICAAQDYHPIYPPAKMEAVNAALDAFDGTAPMSPSPVVPNAIPSNPVVSSSPSSSAQPSEYSEPPVASEGTANASSSKVKVSGTLRTSVGFYANGDVTFFRANGNLTERNYDLLSRDQLFKGQNTYDPDLYTSLNVVVDAPVNPTVSVHLNLTMDPWSYTGKTETKSVTGTYGNDTANVQYLFWGNTGYSLGQIVGTNQLGDSFIIPEQKLHGNTVPETKATGSFTPFPDVFTIPAMKVNFIFQPVREAWVDIKPENDTTIRIFPIAYQDQALTSDDPFKLSNNTIWWEESPWIWDWKQGNFNSGVTPTPDFTKGIWDRSLSFIHVIVI